VAAVLQVPAQTLNFAEQSASVGLIHAHAANPGIAYMSPGGAVGDFNGDGAPDVFAVGGSLGADRLFINQGDGTFVEQAAAWGITTTHSGSGACVGDFDNDGDHDLYVTSFGNGSQTTGDSNRLYRNNGDGTFTDVANLAGVRDSRVSGSTTGDAFSPAFGDFDLDGDLDLAVAGWYGGNQLFRNNGDGTFTNITTFAIPTDMTTVRGFTPTFQDINGDLWPDLLWVADFLTSRLLLNNGDGTFTDITTPAGVGLDTNGMGSAVADFNSDGLFDWYVTSRYSSTTGLGSMLYLNQGDLTFAEVSDPAGVEDGGWGWGAEAADFNHDGLVDIIATNGWSAPEEFANDSTRLFLNNGDGTFSDQAIASGLIHTGQGRGLAKLDADMDGDIDIVIFCNNEGLAYFENQLSGPNTNWIALRFDTSNREDLAPDGFGTTAVIDINGTTQTAAMHGGSNYLATSEFGVHFGLGAATAIDTMTVTWASGETTVLTNVAANQILTIIAPAPDCPADFAPPEGVLDFFDVAAFLAAFSAQDPSADFAPPEGVFDFFDVASYLAAFSEGCP